MSQTVFNFTDGNSGKITKNGLFYAAATGSSNCSTGVTMLTGALWRAFFQFDTSSLPSNALISAVEFYVELSDAQQDTDPETWITKVSIGDFIGSALDGNVGEWNGGTLMRTLGEIDPYNHSWLDLNGEGLLPWVYVDPDGTTDIKIGVDESIQGSGDANWSKAFNNVKVKCRLRVTWTIPQAEVTGKGTASGAATVRVAGSAEVTGKGTATGAARVTVSSSATVTGIGTAAGAAQVTVSAQASVTGRGTASGSAAVTVHASATVTGRGTASGSASVTYGTVYGSATVTGIGTAAGTARVTVHASAEVTGRGTASGSASVETGLPPLARSYGTRSTSSSSSSSGAAVPVHEATVSVVVLDAGTVAVVRVDSATRAVDPDEVQSRGKRWRET